MLHTHHRVTRVAQRTAKAPFRVAWSHASPQRSAAQPRLRTVVHSSQSASLTDEQQAQSAWDQLRLLQSKMDMAVTNEDYSLAAQARDQYNLIKEGLPPLWQYMFVQLEVLQRGSTPDKQAAIKNLAEAGDESVLPDLSRCLTVAELSEPAGEAMWAIFMRSKDPQVNELMERGVSCLGAHDLPQALETFDTMVSVAPGFAEAYNKRATCLYLMQRYQDSIDDCKRVMQLNPYHFGAISGMGLCHVNLGQREEAITAFEQALQLNPGLDTIAMYIKQLKRQV